MLRNISIFIFLFSAGLIVEASAIQLPEAEGVISPYGSYVARIQGIDASEEEVQLFRYKESKYQPVSQYPIVNGNGSVFRFLSDNGYLVTLGSRQEPDKALVIYGLSGKVIKKFGIDNFLSKKEQNYISNEFHRGLEEHWFCRECLFNSDFGFYEGKYFLLYDFFNREHRIFLENGKHISRP